MKHAKNIYQLLFEQAAQGMVVRQGERIVLANQSFADMVDYSVDELLAFSFEEALALVHPLDRDILLVRHQDRMAGKEVPSHYEYRFIRRNGEIGWWAATLSVIDYQGAPASLGTYIDITERKRAEEAVQRGRELLGATLDALPVGVCLTDEAGHYRMMNDAYCAIYEYDRDEMLGQHYSVIMPPDQIALANTHYARLLSGDTGIPVERKRQRKDGSIVYIEAANALVEDVDGQTMVITTVSDITERRMAVETLRENEQLLTEIAANYPNSYVSIIEPDLTVGFSAGQEFAKQNLNPDEFVGLTTDQIFGEQAPLVQAHYLTAFAGEEVTFELIINNQHHHFTVIPLPDRDGHIPHILAVIENITERKQTAEKLVTLAHDLGERVKELDCLYGIARLVEEPGLSLDEILGRTANLFPPAFHYPAITCARILFEEKTFTTPNFIATPWQLSSDIIAFGKTVGRLDVGHLEERPALAEGPFMAEERALIDAVAEHLGNVIEREWTEEALRNNERLIRAIGDNLPAGMIYQRIVHSDGTSHFTYLSAGVEHLFDCRVDDALNDPGIVLDQILAEDREAMAQAIEQSIRDMSVFDYEVRVQKKPGDIRWYHMISRPQTLANDDVLFNGICLDVTAHRQAEQQRLSFALEHERTQILKNFIAQASHEFRTPLSTISASTYVLKKSADPDKQQRHIVTIKTQVESLTALVNAMITMINVDGIQKLSIGAVDICEIINSIRITKQKALHVKGIQSILELKPCPGTVQGNVGYLQQAIEAVIDNAIRFTPDGGTIHIGLEQIEKNVIIDIADTGIGISDTDLPFIFERFYRADKAGTTRGFGLGLSIAKTIIEQHQGTIEVESESGKGSTFRIVLPVS